MYCSSCGENIPSDSDFCPECGTPISAGRSPTPPAQPAPQPAAPPSGGSWQAPDVPGPVAAARPGPTASAVGRTTPAVSPGLNLGVIIASVIIPFVGMIMGAIYLNNADPEKKAAGKRWLWVGVGAFVFWLLVTLGDGY